MESSDQNKIGWESPSNIAIIKYWGKHGNQLPNNVSISFTLSQATTKTYVEWKPKSNDKAIDVQFTLENQRNQSFEDRITKFLGILSEDQLPFLKDYSFQIDSSNSFPHSSGIASSASGMSALALCLCSIENIIYGNDPKDFDIIQKASIISRIGSGSASRSVLPEMALWGNHPKINESSDQYAIAINDKIDPVFKSFRDDILIVSAEEKSVSSSVGHNLMFNNPFANIRYAQANERALLLLDALKDGDLDTFGQICEAEALTLHALMMCSEPSYMLMKEASLTIINKIRAFRNDTNIPIYFTLDAGPNVHVLYPDSYHLQLESFIQGDLKPLCHNGRIISDQVGKGPKLLDL